MSNLTSKAFGGLLFLFVAFAAMLFIPAWTFSYWQAWTFLVVFFVSASAISAYLMKNDPKLLERRASGSEQETSQKIIQFLLTIAFLASVIIPSLDHRFAWSVVPPYVVIIGDALVALALLVIFLVFKENTFTSRVVEVDAEQRVISTGPYALVRHPMYMGALFLFIGIPLALGSWWGLLTFIPLTLIIIWRLLDEERFLATNLPGYVEYRNNVRYRLVPFIW
jgi:protein-S-isoprenylcysteine O-methyltransferase Ste14